LQKLLDTQSESMGYVAPSDFTPDVTVTRNMSWGATAEFPTSPEGYNVTLGYLDPSNGTNDTALVLGDVGTAARVVKGIFMLLIIFSAVFGNILTIIAVFKMERLRIVANSFIVSLAFADLLVAILVMPFSASIELAGRWMFGSLMCDIFNANDVLFSSASLLHICCISMDRYIAIMDPYHYETKMTKRRAGVMLFCVWGASALLSHIPVHLGWYTTEKQQRELRLNEDECTFVVNKVYCAISSSISFWIPSSIMVFTYVMIYREARRQEKQIHALTQMAGVSMEHLNKVGNGNGHADSGTQRNGSHYNSENHRLSQERRKMKREHKAAKTLGIIMGAFLFCWLPFFLWYVSSTMCGESCYTPDIVVSMLFWIGYFNSALNPLIYAFFNRDFRNAFKKLLTNDRCAECCRGLCSRWRCTCSSKHFGWCSKTENGPETDALKSTFTTEMQPRSRPSFSTSSKATPSPIKHPPHYDSVD
jgi:hypothetical protein